MSDPVHFAAWQIDARGLDPHTSVEETLRFALHYAVLAPSTHNTQPWRFIVDDDTVLVCADRLRALPVIDPYDRELTVSCGAALFNLRVALSRFGLAYAITPLPSEADPDVLARLRILPGDHCDGELAALFDAIPRRVTTRAPFAGVPVATEIARRLVEAGTAEGAEVVCIADDALRDRISGLIADADRMQFADPRFRRELASWIHPRCRDDGMPASAAQAGALLDSAAPLAALAIRTFDVGGNVAATHRRLAADSPLLVCLASGDDAPSWLAAGQALERMLLTGVNDGLTASYLNQPIEVEPLRETLRAMLGLRGIPQLLLRMGHGPATGHAPRRPLDEIVS